MTAATTAVETATVEAAGGAVSVNAHKGVSAVPASVSAAMPSAAEAAMPSAAEAAIEAMVETGVKAAVEAKAERAVEEAGAPKPVVISIGVPEPALPDGIVTSRVLRDQFVLVGFRAAAGSAPDVQLVLLCLILIKAGFLQRRIVGKQDLIMFADVTMLRHAYHVCFPIENLDSRRVGRETVEAFLEHVDRGGRECYFQVSAGNELVDFDEGVTAREIDSSIGEPYGGHAELAVGADAEKCAGREQNLNVSVAGVESLARLEGKVSNRLKGQRLAGRRYFPLNVIHRTGSWEFWGRHSSGRHGAWLHGGILLRGRLLHGGLPWLVVVIHGGLGETVSCSGEQGNN